MRHRVRALPLPERYVNLKERNDLQCPLVA
jgi:hypothetical protein